MTCKALSLLRFDVVNQPTGFFGGVCKNPHIERWNNTLRQRLARFVRKTLSFSKSDMMHRIMLGWFIIEYNLQVPSLYYLTTIQQSLFYELL